MFRKIISSVISLCLIFTLFSFGITAKAEIINKGNIIIEKVSGVTGDTIIVPIKIQNNPGIMAITISITYNSDALEYERYYYGDVFNDYTVADHPSKNLIRYVSCGYNDKKNDGTMLSLQFKIKENAEAEFHKINIEYSQGDFCNWNLDKIMPEITEGGVEVAFNGNNCSHKKYGEWTVATKPSCKDKGVDQRICEKCGHVDLKDTKPLGHEYSDKWTVDEPATAEKAGVMSRYCIRCTDFVDRMTFTLENTEDGKIYNNYGADVPINDYTEEIFKEQFPDKELTKNPTPSDSEPTLTNPLPDSVLENIIPEIENSNGEKISVLKKISEVFPKFEAIEKAAKISFVALLILIFQVIL